MKISYKLLTTGIISLMLLSGCGADNKKDAVITINGTPITKQAYKQQFNQLAKNPMFAQMGVNLSDQNSYVALMLKDKIINELMVKAILEDSFKKNNIQATEEDIQNEIKNIIDKVGSKEKFQAILKQNGISTEQFKQDLKEEIKVKKLIASLSKTSISENMTKDFYNKNIDKFKYPDKVRASHILISADPERIKTIIMAEEGSDKYTEAQIQEKIQKTLNEKKAKAEKILAEAKNNPEKFAQIAKENSDDPGSAQQGGDLGYFTREQMVEAFSKAAFEARPSVVTGVVKSPYGYHIILVKDRITAGIEPYDKVKEEIKAYLEEQEKLKVLQNFLTEEKNKADIKYIDKSFNPEEIQKKIKEQIKDMPENQEQKK